MSDSKQLEFYFDYASPYAFLANETLGEHFPGIEINYKPIYLRGLETFRTAMPFVPNKLKYIMKDIFRCAKQTESDLKFPSHFPINGIYACRGALFALANGGFDAYHQSMFRAAWSENKNTSDKQTVIDIAVEAGQNRNAFAAGIDHPALKEQLKNATQKAEQAGLFGVPSFIVNDELFWGCDRIEQVKQKLAI